MRTTRGTDDGFVPRLFLERGFTLPELIGVLVIAGILLAVAAPKLIRGGFDESALYEQARASLRYAQGAALAMQRTVCVQFTATTVTFRYDPVYGGTSCTGDLAPPTGGAGPYQIQAQGAASFTAFPASFSFDRIGRPSAAQVITLSNGAQVRVEAESGYVY